MSLVSCNFVCCLRGYIGQSILFIETGIYVQQCLTCGPVEQGRDYKGKINTNKFQHLIKFNLIFIEVFYVHHRNSVWIQPAILFVGEDFADRISALGSSKLFGIWMASASTGQQCGRQLGFRLSQSWFERAEAVWSPLKRRQHHLFANEVFSN